MGYVLKVAGLECNVAPGATIPWSLAYGVQPVQVTLELTTSRIAEIYAKGQSQFASGRTRERGAAVGPVSLEFLYPEDPRRNMIQRGLYVVERGPGDGLNTETITLADRRFLAPRTVVRRRYNIRRESGERRLIKTALEPIQLGRSAPDFVFQRITLDGGAPWVARRVLEDVLEEVFGTGGWKIPANVPLRLSDDVESLELFDQGDEALQRLSYLIPGLRFFVDYDGKVTVANVYDPRGVKMAKALGTQYLGDARLASRDVVIPRSFRVYFDAESELRFDFNEADRDPTATGSGSTTTTTTTGRTSVIGEEGRETRTIENVVLCPLLELPLRDNGSRTNATATLGEPVPFPDFLDAVNDLMVDEGMTKPPITQAEIRRVWMGQWPGWSQSYLKDYEKTGGDLAKWSLIMTAIRTHWRKTWRILPQWVDKIRNLRAERAAILDSENGTRARATVHTQWVQLLTQYGMDPDLGARQHVENDDYADDISGDTSGAVGVSPFDLELLNPDLGIFRLVPRVDEDGLASTYHLGAAEGSWPAGDIREAVVMHAQVSLASGFKLAVVLSGMKSVPNGIGALYSVEVPVAEAAAKLGIPAPKSSGSDYELRATEETARFAWVDDSSEAIENAFYDGTPLPSELLVNEDAVKSLALAHASRRLATLLPRIKGQLRGRLNAKLSPVGGIQSVTHTVTVPATGAGAVGQTTLAMPGEVEAPSVWSLMPEGVRRRLRGQVDR